MAWHMAMPIAGHVPVQAVRLFSCIKVCQLCLVTLMRCSTQSFTLAMSTLRVGRLRSL